MDELTQEDLYNIFQSIPTENVYHVGIDEAGRGPLFGRVYVACVILPDKETLELKYIKDSKKFTSKKKLLEAYHYIKRISLAYSINYAEVDEIDTHNILQATIRAMHRCIIQLFKSYPQYMNQSVLLIDGNYFKSITIEGKNIPYYCIKGGDNTHSCISAASILAKVERDTYIEQLCNSYPMLYNYGLNKHKGYGTKQHIESLHKYGLTKYHRKTFGICKKINSYYCLEE